MIRRMSHEPKAAHQACSHPESHVHDAAAYLAEVEAVCRERGLRLTALREQVLRLIADADRPVKAYALLSMANAQGLPQAAAALAQMDANVPLAQRQQAAGLAIEMQRQADATRGRALAAADLGTGVSGGSPVQGVANPTPAIASRAPAKVTVSPSVAAALAAVAEARQATATGSPADAGASFAHHKSSLPQLAAAAAAPKTKAKLAPAAPPPKPAASATAAPADGPWRVQLGAFSVRGNADKLWRQLSGRSELAGKPRLTVAAGAVTKLQAGGFASRDAAEAACRSLQHGGHECLVTR